MRKHNTALTRTFWNRLKGDRSNFPQTMVHALVTDKRHQFLSNTLLQQLLARI